MLQLGNINVDTRIGVISNKSMYSISSLSTCKIALFAKDSKIDAYVACIGDLSRAETILVAKSEGKKLQGRPRHRWGG
jgi:hypothetical protein